MRWFFYSFPLQTNYFILIFSVGWEEEETRPASVTSWALNAQILEDRAWHAVYSPWGKKRVRHGLMTEQQQRPDVLSAAHVIPTTPLRVKGQRACFTGGEWSSERRTRMFRDRVGSTIRVIPRSSPSTGSKTESLSGWSQHPQCSVFWNIVSQATLEPTKGR